MLTTEHFSRAIDDIAAHGDNDTLPFDVDCRFVAESKDTLISVAEKISAAVAREGKEFAVHKFNEVSFFSERLLTPAGPAGFRVTTKIHPFWNFYFNALGVAIAERHEPYRSARAHSYRFSDVGPSFFDASQSWRKFKERTLEDCLSAPATAVVVQTDVSSFYEHIYHHRIQNFIDELFPDSPTISVQIDRMLSSFASGRSFGLPVGGQCSRVLAELLMSKIDQRLTDEGVVWRRYVDDFVLVAENQSSAYRVLAILSHALADYGLSLNKTKTNFLAVPHYVDLVKVQLGGDDEQSNALRAIDLRFDPYSDTAEADYEELKAAVQHLDVMRLVGGELEKSQPDNFIVTQVSRTLRLLAPPVALEVCTALLTGVNMHSFRASFSKILRGVSQLRDEPEYATIHEAVDSLLDSVPLHSSHLLSVDSNCLHYLRALRFRRTDARAKYVASIYASGHTETVGRACIDCWRSWKDRDRFIALRSRWATCGAGEQRMVWLAAKEFGDDGVFMKKQLRASVLSAWGLGFDNGGTDQFASAYVRWCEQ